MANKEFEVETDRRYTITPGGNATAPAAVNLFTIIETSKCGNKSKPNSRQMLTSPISYTIPARIAGYCAGAGVFNDYGGGGSMLPPTSIKVKAETKIPYRKGDTGTCVCVFVWFAFVLGYGSCTWTITDAGQTKSKGE